MKLKFYAGIHVRGIERSITFFRFHLFGWGNGFYDRDDYYYIISVHLFSLVSFEIYGFYC